jgi:hypothetical protein
MRRTLVLLTVLLTVLSLLLGGVLSPIRAEGENCLREDAPGCTHGLPSGEYERLLAEMQAHPAPDVTPIEVDRKEVGQFTFWKVLPNTSLYDLPNGNIVGKMDDGFSFVSIYQQKDGFGQLKNKLWVHLSSLKRTFASTYAGILLDKPLKYPMAWVIQASIPSRVPGGDRSPKTPAINRYKRVYIYATVRIGNWDWYLVGPGQWLEQRKVARVVPAANPGIAGKWVSVNLYEQVLTAYEGDKLLFATLVSSGLPQWQTNTGAFKVWSKYRTTPMSGAMGEPDFYSLPAVPYVMYFDNEISLHGTYWHDGFGFKRSHGCVNMSISDARWVYNWMGDGELNVVVINERTG